MSRKRSSKWGCSVGDRPNTVRLFEREPGSSLYLRVWDRTNRRYVKRCLGHRDRARGKAQALELAARLARGEEEIRENRVRLGQLFALYREHRTPQKSPKEQKEDDRRLRLWTRYLGSSKDPHKISRGEWEAFIRDRASGRLAASGKIVHEDEQRGVNP